MSRSKNGRSRQQYEYWSRRPNSGGAVGRWAKTNCHRIERRHKDDIVRTEVRQYESSHEYDIPGNRTRRAHPV